MFKRVSTPKQMLLEFAYTDGITEDTIPKPVQDMMKHPQFAMSDCLVQKFIAEFPEHFRLEIEAREEHMLAESAIVTEKGATRGQTVSDSTGAGLNMQVAATLEIYNLVVRGYTRFMSDVWVKKYPMSTVDMMIPKVEYVEAVVPVDPVTAGVPVTNKEIDYVTLSVKNPESERGARITWTRAAIEDVTFDMQAEMLEGLGFAVAQSHMKLLIETLNTVAPTNMPNGSVLPIDPTGITWDNFVDLIHAVDIGVEQVDGTFKTYGMCDYVLVSPDVYRDLFKVLQMTNVLYKGSTEAVQQGVINTALGISIVRLSNLPRGTAYALNSNKAVAMGIRRDLKVEPIFFPERNRYGWIGTTRVCTAIVYPQAIQKATI